MKTLTAEVEIDFKDGKVAIEMISKEDYELEDCEIGKVIILNLCNGETYTGLFKGMDGEDVMIGSLSGKNTIGLSTSVKDNFKEIRLPTGNCLKCKKEIKTYSLESKEVLQVENTVFNIDFGGHVMVGLKIINGEIEVVGAINGYGNGISTDEIRITKSNQ